MSDSSLLIKKYFCSIESNKLSSSINQVELIAELTAEFCNADFVALYYKHPEDGSIFPLAYHNRTDIEIAELSDLDKRWNNIKDESWQSDFSKLHQSKNDHFASKNNFKFCYIQPNVNEKSFEVFAVVYWNDKPDFVPKDSFKIIEYFLKVILTAVSKSMESRQLSEYSLRLSELIAMFETPAGKYKFNELLVKLLNYVKKSIPKFKYVLFSYDRISKLFLMTGKLPIPKLQASVASIISRQLIELTNLKEFKNTPKGTLFDLSAQFQDQFTALLATPICYEMSKEIFLVAYSNEKDAISQNNRELMSVFSLFANNILRDALLINKIGNVNRLLKKSSSQLADIETLAALTDMTSGVAHDFNNTIGGIIGRVQLLKLKTEDEDILNGLNKIEKLSLEGAGTVKRLQEFTTGVKSKKLVPLDMIESIYDYFERPSLNWKKTATLKNLSVKVKNKFKDAIILGSDSDLMVVLEKLLDNAVEHSDENSEIKINISEDKKYYQLSISNRGTIIDDKIIKKIFYPFFTTKDKYGAGLGLSIVQGIVIRHGGKVECESDGKSGTVFKLYFPKPDKIDEDSEVSRKKKTKENLKILVVDDDEQIREVLDDMLTIEGHIITTCEDGSSALKEFETEEFDLMITDLGMPGMSGLELAGLVHENNPKLPIAMITGWGTQLNDEETALKGIKIVMPKPFHLKDIKEMIEDIVV